MDEHTRPSKGARIIFAILQKNEQHTPHRAAHMSVWLDRHSYITEHNNPVPSPCPAKGTCVHNQSIQSLVSDATIDRERSAAACYFLTGASQSVAEQESPIAPTQHGLVWEGPLTSPGTQDNSPVYHQRRPTSVDLPFKTPYTEQHKTDQQGRTRTHRGRPDDCVGCMIYQ